MKRKREKAWKQKRKGRGKGGPRSAPRIKRECGGCTACCCVLEVPWLEKAPYVRCEHAVDGVGCGIYETRPKECGDFRCAWLNGRRDFDFLTEDDRPDRIGVMFVEKDDGTGYQGIQAWELEPGALESERARALIGRFRGMKCIITEVRPHQSGSGIYEKLITPTIDGRPVMLKGMAWGSQDNANLLF